MVDLRKAEEPRQRPDQPAAHRVDSVVQRVKHEFPVSRFLALVEVAGRAKVRRIAFCEAEKALFDRPEPVKSQPARPPYDFRRRKSRQHRVGQPGQKLREAPEPSRLRVRRPRRVKIAFKPFCGLRGAR